MNNKRKMKKKGGNGVTWYIARPVRPRSEKQTLNLATKRSLMTLKGSGLP
jgi:hypothetical protein